MDRRAIVPSMSGRTRSPVVTALFGSRPRTAISATSLALLSMAAAWAHPLLLSIDRPFSLAIRGESLVTPLRAVTALGGVEFVLGASLLVAAWVWGRCPSTAALLVVTILVGAVANVVLKVIINRPRPIDALTGTALASFPSGHTVLVTLLMGILPIALRVVTHRRWAFHTAVVLGTTTIAAVGFSRIYLGAHWPTDVAGGVVVGAMLVALAEIAFVRWIRHRRCACTPD